MLRLGIAYHSKETVISLTAFLFMWYILLWRCSLREDYMTSIDWMIVHWAQANPTADTTLKVVFGLLALLVSWYLIKHPEVVADE